MVKIFNLDFYDENLENLKIELEKDIDENKKVRVYTPNVDHIINIKSNENVFLKYSKAEYIIADGWPVVATAKVKKTPIHKITGVDLMDELLKLADKKSLNIFFLGATDYTLKKLKFNIERDFNNINLINYNNGYFSKKESERIVKKINDTNSNILFVGMGSPKQEIWITENIEKLNVNITIAVGGALKIYSEEIERAPKFVQQIGMEWFYRFMKEPKRLFSRYFVKYPKFIKHFIDEIKE